MSWRDRWSKGKAAVRRRTAKPRATRTEETEVPRSRDPWYSDATRRAEVNANSSRARPGWIPRLLTKGWLRKDRSS